MNKSADEKRINRVHCKRRELGAGVRMEGSKLS
jgi:hypothetical protein